MATAYSLFSRGARTGIEFKRVRSQKLLEFHMTVESILSNRIQPAATQFEGLSISAVFLFHDSDLLGRSHVLASVFDHSGEFIQRPGPDLSELQDMDGCLLFLNGKSIAKDQLECAHGRRRSDRRALCSRRIARLRSATGHGSFFLASDGDNYGKVFTSEEHADQRQTMLRNDSVNLPALTGRGLFLLVRRHADLGDGGNSVVRDHCSCLK